MNTLTQSESSTPSLANLVVLGLPHGLALFLLPDRHDHPAQLSSSQICFPDQQTLTAPLHISVFYLLHRTYGYHVYHS